MLTKLPRYTLVPGVPAQPEIPFRAAYTVCAPDPPPTGSSVLFCEMVNVPVGVYTLDDFNNGRCTYAQIGTTKYILMGPVCSSRFVQTAPGGPIRCVNHPEQPFVPAVPGVPARLDVTFDAEWNAGANSIVEVIGDAILSFPMGKVVAAVVGFVSDRDGVDNYLRITHGLLFTSVATAQRVQVIEAGQVLGVQTPYLDGDTFELRRVGNVVSYRHNGVLLRSSRSSSTGDLITGSAVYATGDDLESTSGGDCFWTDLLRVVQECGGEPSTQLQAITTYGFGGGGLHYSDGCGLVALQIEAATTIELIAYYDGEVDFGEMCGDIIDVDAMVRTPVGPISLTHVPASERWSYDYTALLPDGGTFFADIEIDGAAPILAIMSNNIPV